MCMTGFTCKSSHHTEVSFPFHRRMMHRKLLLCGLDATLNISKSVRQNIDMNVSSQGNIQSHLTKEATVEVASWKMEHTRSPRRACSRSMLM